MSTLQAIAPASLIQIKYSVVTAVPATLYQGELAYSENSKKLFIGDSNGVPVEIAGESFIARLGSVETAVLAIQNYINNNLAADLQGLKDADTDLQAKILALQTAAAADEQALADLVSVVAQNKLAAETAVQGAKSEASSALTSAVTPLQTRLTAVEGAVTQLGTDTATNLAAAVSTLDGKIDQSVATLDSKIAAVKVEAADLSTSVDNRFAAVDTEIESVKTQITNGVTADVTALQAKDVALKGEIDALGVRVTDVEGVLGGAGNVVFSNATITGDLVVQGTTTAINTEISTIKDPVITLGQGTNAADGNDRGIEYKWFDAANNQAKTGFFGLDSSEGKFKFIPEATATGANTFTGDVGVIVADLEGSASKLAAARNISLSGDLTGSAAFDGSSDVEIAVVVQAETTAVANTVLRRDSNGGVQATTILASDVASLRGGADGSGSALTNFVISGGTF